MERKNVNFSILVPAIVLGILVVASAVSASSTISTNIQTDGTLSVTGTSTLMGNVGIGTTTPGALLDIGVAGAGTDVYGLRVADQTAGTNNWNIWSGPDIESFNPDDNWVVSGSKNVFGSVNFASHNTNYILGTMAQDNSDQESDAAVFGSVATNAAGVTKSKAMGVSGLAILNGSGTVNNLIAINAALWDYGTGMVVNASNFYAEDNGNYDGVIQNLYGLNIQSKQAGLYNFAIYTNQTASSTNPLASYALYNNGTAPSYFAGNVGIGTTTPQSQLQVTSGASATTTVTIGELGLTSSKSCVNMNRSNGQPASFYINNAGAMVVETNYCR